LNFNETISAASSLPQKFRLLCSSMRAITAQEGRSSGAVGTIPPASR
jgi:hypothetical protein